MSGVKNLIRIAKHNNCSGEKLLLDGGLQVSDLVRHRVALYFPFDTVSPYLDPKLRGNYKKRMDQIQLRTLRQMQAFKQVNFALKKQGIECTLIKGLALNDHLYQGKVKRTARDLDVLVKRSQVFQTHETLKQQGFEKSSPSFEIKEGQKELFLSEFNQIAYYHPVWRTQVEIHWRLFKSKVRLPLSEDNLWNLTVPVENKNGLGRYTTLHPKLHLVFVSLHGLNHQWDSLIWLFDLEQFLTIISEEDLQFAIDLVVEHDLLNEFLVGFAVIRDVLEVVLPKSIENLMNEKVNTVANDCIQFLEDKNTGSKFMKNWKKWRFNIKSFNSSSERFTSYYSFPTYSLEMLPFKSKAPHVLLRPTTFVVRKLKRS